MAITINGSGTITGVSAGGLPDGCVDADTLASGVGGKVLQVVSNGYSTTTSTNSNTFVDTGLSATITPTSSTSKILVIVSHPATGVGNPTAAGNRVTLKLLRGSTVIQGLSYLAAYNNNNQRATETVASSYLDSPATTSATTYKTQFANDNGGETIYVNWNSNTYTPNQESTMTLMEIAG